MNPLNDVPLNTKRCYVMATALNGCEIYMPVDSRENEILTEKKKRLQEYLNHQYEKPLDVA